MGWPQSGQLLFRAAFKEIATDLPNTVFYACGPNALVDFAEQLVVHGLGLPKEQMKTEKWG